MKARKARAPKIERLRDRLKSRSSRKIAPFCATDYLDDEADVREYLAAALEDPNSSVFLDALYQVAKSRGFTEVATTSGLTQRALENIRVRSKETSFEAVRRIMAALGMRLAVAPA